MKLIVSIKNVEMYSKISSYVDGIVLGCDYSFYANGKFTKDDIIKLASKTDKNKQKLYILVNLVMHHEYEERVRSFLKDFAKTSVYFIYQDLGVYQILKDLGMGERGVYFPLTMICNYEDMKVYESLGVDAVGLSNEITLDDVKLCTEKLDKVFYLGFGYHPMYQTYRKVISLYKEYSGLKFENENLSIRELSKKEIVPITENEFGAVIFRRGLISVLSEIEKVMNVKYLYLDGIFLEEEKQLKIIKIYSDVTKNGLSKEEGMKMLDSLNLTYSNNFMDTDSVYDPEDF